MTTFKKVLWRIAGIVPLVATVFATVFILPLNYYSGTRERIGLAAWILLFVLSVLVLLPLVFWNSSCVNKSTDSTPTGWQRHFDVFHSEKKWVLLILGTIVVLWIAAILLFM
jgi:hypothetical protein